MKKIVFLFIMSLTFSVFSSNSISAINLNDNSISNKINFNLSEIVNNSNTFMEDTDWVSTCYVTVVNTVTGQERRVYGTGTGSSPGAALQNCERNARANAKALYNIE